MHAFEIALSHLSIKPTDHVLVAGLHPAWHELSLVLSHLSDEKGILLYCDILPSKVEHLARIIDNRGLTGKIVAYQGTVDALYGSVVAEESVDVLLYVLDSSHNHAKTADEVKRILKTKGIFAVIEKTPLHPLSKGKTHTTLQSSLLEAGFRLQKTVTADHAHSVLFFIKSDGIY